MKNLLKMAVVALALSCFQAYGHSVCVEYSHDHVHHQQDNYEYMDCNIPGMGPVCNRKQAACEAERRYNAIRIIRVKYYPHRDHYRVTLIDRQGNRRTETIDLDCRDGSE